MFNIFRAVGRLLSATSADTTPVVTTAKVEETTTSASAPVPSTETNVTPSSTSTPVPTTETNATPSPSSTPTPPANSSSATSSLDFWAAFNYAARSPNYARPVEQYVRRSSFGRPVDAPKSTSDVNGTSTRHLDDIPSPHFPLFEAADVNIDQSAASADEPADDISKTSAPPTPPATPPNQRDTSEPPFAEGKRSHTATQTGTQQTQHTTPPRHPQSTTSNWVDEIIYETSTPGDPLPENYIGTFRRIRYYAADYTAMLPCGSENNHHLLCGHYIASALPCGRNCKTRVLDESPFTCPTCHSAIDEFLNAKMSAEETAKLKELEGVNVAVFSAYCVELVTRALPGIKGGVADAVTAFLNTRYGRGCVASAGPAKVETLPLRKMVGAMQGGWERRQRGVKEDMLNSGTREEREKHADEAVGARAGEEAGEGRSEAKKKLESHPEPITRETCRKRRFSFSHASSSSSPASPSPPHKRNRKAKHKFLSHQSPTTTLARGYKRSSPSLDDDESGAKKQCMQPALWGQVGFLEQPVRLGAVVRTRKRDGGLEDVFGDLKGGRGKMARLHGWRAVRTSG
ncbi:hypothetical protein PTNB85_04591 [Pyrenophora teres f. teres]|uniref:Lamp domain containing protein n=1 Tax=Pyrenophora teres f. teres TaxID=97479 RepID=A0A6S6VZ76_9PLEO|nr:hypothetical protein HRS9139_04857 [Pyrenophora teres f. teres]KAE8841192.1 hypothetical protein PTNB85_04591 [Pyrenophora teres f. teres]KAE8864689.1 hypothetical protein PTNB29_04653 [Pyrenophora teres f. teres]CAE7030217.1 Lamp domain containing protein [Pyrenophora teres f. teres]